MLICESKDLKKEEPRLRCWVHCSHYLIFGCTTPLYQNLYLGFLQNTIYDFSNGWVPFMPAPPLICQPVVLSEPMLLFLLPRVVSRDLSIVSWHPVLILLLNPWDSWWRCRLISIIIGDQSVVDLTCKPFVAEWPLLLDASHDLPVFHGVLIFELDHLFVINCKRQIEFHKTELFVFRLSLILLILDFQLYALDIIEVVKHYLIGHHARAQVLWFCLILPYLK